MILIVNKHGGLGIRKPCGTLVSYALHNWSTGHITNDIERAEYIKAKWNRFIRLLSRVSKDFAIIKDDQLVYRKGYERLTKEYYK